MPNSVTNDGKDNALNANFHGGTQNTKWCMGLIDSAGYALLSSTDTYQLIRESKDIVLEITPPAISGGWNYRKLITISNTNIDEYLINFPLYVPITNDSDLGNALATGYDIRFTAADGTTLLNYEREYWTGGGGSAVTAAFWVQIPAMNHISTTSFYIYYGNSTAVDGQNITATWDTNFRGVWHLAETATSTAGDYKDSTSYINNSTNTTGEPTRIGGKIGYGQQFTGGQRVQVPDVSTLTNPSVTVSVWVNPSSLTGSNIIGFDAGYVLEVGRIAANKVGAYIFLNGSWRGFGFAYTLSTSAWTHLILTYNNVTGDAMLYVNGTLYSTINQAGNYSITRTNAINCIGGYSGSLYFSGIIDEARVSAVVRTAAWNKFEYYNINSATNELTWSAYESIPYISTAFNRWGEFINYTDANGGNDTTTRPVWYNNSASGQSVTNTIKSIFDITIAGTAKGIFLVGGPTAQTKGDSSSGNTLWATALFNSDTALAQYDRLEVDYAINV
jgi:hypothetical protein